MRKILPLIGGILLAVVVMLIPIDGLSFRARAALAILTLAIVWWIFKVLPDFVTAMLMGVLFVFVADVPMTTVFSAFSGSTWWLLLTAFGLSLGISKCGVLKRISLYLLNLFPKSFFGQLAGLTAVGFVSAPFIPSMSAKAAVLAPLSFGISDSIGYERQGKQAAGLFVAMLTGLRTPGPLFVSASVIGYALKGQYPAEINQQFTMGKWFMSALPWFIMVTIVNLIVIYLLYKPAHDAPKPKDVFVSDTNTLLPMSRNEKIMTVIIVVTLVLWITENLHGIPAPLVAMVALCLTIATGILNAKEFCAEMNWDSLIFIGFALGIASVFNELDINSWIVELFMPVFSFFSSNPIIFLVCIAFVTILLRFVIVSEMAYINIILVFLIPMAESMGINPWVVGLTVYAVISPWFFLYQNPVYMAAYHATKGEMIKHRDIVWVCLFYLIICTVAIIASVPYWINIGIFYI